MAVWWKSSTFNQIHWRFYGGGEDGSHLPLGLFFIIQMMYENACILKFFCSLCTIRLDHVFEFFISPRVAASIGEAIGDNKTILCKTVWTNTCQLKQSLWMRGLSKIKPSWKLLITQFIIFLFNPYFLSTIVFLVVQQQSEYVFHIQTLGKKLQFYYWHASVISLVIILVNFYYNVYCRIKLNA